MIRFCKIYISYIHAPNFRMKKPLGKGKATEEAILARL